MADRHIFLRILFEQDGFRDADAIWHHHGRAVGIMELVQGFFVNEPRHKARRHRGIYHLLPRTEALLRALGIRGREDESDTLLVVGHGSSLLEVSKHCIGFSYLSRTNKFL